MFWDWDFFDDDGLEDFGFDDAFLLGAAVGFVEEDEDERYFRDLYFDEDEEYRD